jgi:diguanylate cyclase (GGDEF)-like protein/PAS domain S-box-containing protein
MPDPGRTERPRRLRWSNLSLRAKGFVVVAIPVGGLLLAQSALLLAQGASTRADEAAREAAEARTAVRSVLIAVLDAETSVRGYLLTGDRSHLYGYRQAVVALPQHLGRLRRLASRQREKQAVERIERLVAQRLEVADLLRRAPRAEDRRALLQQGQTIMRYLRAELTAFQEGEEEELSLHTANADRYRSTATAVAGSGVILGFLGGALGTAFFTSGVTTRVRRLEDNAERLARGQPLRSLPPGHDEIGRLGRAMQDSATELGRARGLIQGVVEGTSDVVFVKDLDGRYLMMNGAGRSYLGRSLEDIIGRTDEELYEPKLAASIREADREVLRSGETIEHETVDTAGGTNRTFLTTKGPFRDGSGRVAGLFGIARDISDRKETERAITEMNERLRQQAIIDELTGLHNRRAFMAIGEHELRSADRTGRPLAVLFADLDGMKAINDSFGHAEGDRALRDTADIFRSTFRASDVVARLGGDEFCSLLPNCPPDQATVVLGRIEEALRLHRESRPFVLSLSLGVAFHEPGAPESFEDLIRRADAAMYNEKAGKISGL